MDDRAKIITFYGHLLTRAAMTLVMMAPEEDGSSVICSATLRVNSAEVVMTETISVVRLSHVPAKSFMISLQSLPGDKSSLNMHSRSKLYSSVLHIIFHFSPHFSLSRFITCYLVK
jgi:hypothetical protein